MFYIGTMKPDTNNLHLIKHKYSLQYEQAKYLNKQNKSKINTNRPAQAISFGGSALSVGNWIVQNKALNKLSEFVNENEVAYNAIYSLLIAGILKPLIVLRTEGADEKDKQIIATKNFLQAFIGSFMGFTIGGTVVKKATDSLKNHMKLVNAEQINKNGKIKYTVEALDENNDAVKEVAKKALIKEQDNFSHRFLRAQGAFKSNNGIQRIKAFFSKIKKNKTDNIKPSESAIKIKSKELIKNLEENHLKIFQKNPEFVYKLKQSVKENSTLMDAFDSVWKNSTGAFTAVSKAMISSALLPGVMAFIFAKRNLEKAKEEAEKTGAMLNNNLIFKTENKKFHTLLEEQGKNREDNHNIAFSGKIANFLSDGLTLGVEKIAMSKPGEAFVKKMNSLPKVLNKPSARMGDLESVGLTAYWLLNTTASKKIEPSQKLGLNVHTALVTLVSSISAFLIDTVLDPLVKRAGDSYKDIISEAVKKIPEEYIKTDNKEEILKIIKEECKKLSGCENIAKKILSADLNNKAAIDEAIANLSKNYSKKLSKLKSLTVFTFVVRFLVPVALVKPSNKLKQKIAKHKQQKEDKKKI